MICIFWIKKTEIPIKIGTKVVFTGSFTNKVNHGIVIKIKDSGYIEVKFNDGFVQNYDPKYIRGSLEILEDSKES